MKRLRLTDDQKAKLELLHSSTNNGKERDRIKAILLRSEVWTAPMISQALRLHKTTITCHINDYLESKLKSSSSGSDSHLPQAQTQALIIYLEECLYHHVHEIIEYVKATWNVIYSVPGMNHWLHRNGFSYKKPKGHLYKSDKEAQKQFIIKYEGVKSSLKKRTVCYLLTPYIQYRKPK